MKRIATTIAVAALALGAGATVASARPAPPEDGAVTNELTLAWVQYQHQLNAAAKPAKKTAKPAKKKDNRPAKLVYNGKH
jgi:hypothetical protein